MKKVFMLATLVVALASCQSKQANNVSEIDVIAVDSAGVEDLEAGALYYHDTILSDMAQVRREADTLETLTEKRCWPFPTYSDLLFY